MLFDKAMEVEAEQYNPLESFTQTDIAPQLELTLDDLRRIEQEVQQENSDKLPKKGFITTNSELFYKNNIFEEGTEHLRSLFSKDQSENLANPSEIVGIKGTGYSDWLKKHSAAAYEFICGTDKIRYPILISKNYSIDTHRVWGGETRNLADYQYLNALILQALIKRHHLQNASITPLQCMKLKQLLIQENEKIRAVSLKEYCRRQLSNEYFSVPSFDDAEKLVQFVYKGSHIDKRVPPRRIGGGMGDMDGPPMYFAGTLSKYANSNQRWNKIQTFIEKISSLVKIVHSYNGTFTTLRPSCEQYDHKRPLSSLSINNVSLDGVICDLDTVSFINTNSIEESQEWDIHLMIKAGHLFAGLYKTEEECMNSLFDLSMFTERIMNFIEAVYPVPKRFEQSIKEYNRVF